MTSPSNHPRSAPLPVASRPVAGRGPDPAEATSANRAAASSAWSVPAYLLTGAGLFGGVGWLVDQWVGTSFLVGVGVLAGMVLSVYVIWIRYVDPPAGGAGMAPSSPRTRPTSTTTKEVQ